ncbi:MAG: hypothetical protein ACJA01_003822 [Saprospiraceae bacterium]|jgi:hypothetical protein
MRCYISVLIISFIITAVTAQNVIVYGPDNPTAKVLHDRSLYYGYHKNSDNQKLYPVKGSYSPTHYSYSKMGSGKCNYVYIPTDGALLPGHQYHLNLTVKVSEAYSQLPYYQTHFGVALTSDLLDDNDFVGLWRQHFIPLGLIVYDENVTLDFDFRPLCVSEYFVLGVFQGNDMDDKDCYLCQYGFELFSLTVEESMDTLADFVYMCDAFEEEASFNRKNLDSLSIYFESGSADIREEFNDLLDSVPHMLNTVQDLIILSAYTDKMGSDNEDLGSKRNATVYKALINIGIDSNRIIKVNYGETKASKFISQLDRKVTIERSWGKLFQKYYTEALEYAEKEDFRLANSAIRSWLQKVPPDKAIYALFDCWGEGRKASLFKKDLTDKIQSKFYKGKDLKFTLDSMYCEDQKGRALKLYLNMNRMPGYRVTCEYEMDSLRDMRHQLIADQIYLEFGFPTVEDVGNHANQALPYVVLHSSDTIFQKRFLPLLKAACEDQFISWDYSAKLYDKISLKQYGYQRCGTQWKLNNDRQLTERHPFEDNKKVKEYRKQVGLAPLSDY